MNYNNEVKERWGETGAYKEFGEKTKEYSKERFADINSGLENVFRDFAELMKSGATPDSVES